MSALNTKRIGHVYVIEASDAGTVKVGRSGNPDRRLAAIRTQGGVCGRQWVSPLQGDCYELECEAHKSLKEYRHIGEWFRVGFDDAVAAVQSLLKPEPTPQELQEAADHDKALAQEFRNLFATLTPSFHRPFADVDDPEYEAAIFVLDLEDHQVASDFEVGEDEFLARFDLLPANVALLVPAYLHRNEALVRAGIERDRREKLLLDFAMDVLIQKTVDAIAMDFRMARAAPQRLEA